MWCEIAVYTSHYSRWEWYFWIIDQVCECVSKCWNIILVCIMGCYECHDTSECVDLSLFLRGYLRYVLFSDISSLCCPINIIYIDLFPCHPTSFWSVISFTLVDNEIDMAHFFVVEDIYSICSFSKSCSETYVVSFDLVGSWCIELIRFEIYITIFLFKFWSNFIRESYPSFCAVS